MNNMFAKVLTGVSLAAAIALAVPLGLMTAKIVQGESPRQLAEKAADTSVVGDPVPEPVSSADQPENSGQTDGVKPMTVGEAFGVRPQVEPDPKLYPKPEPVSEELPKPETVAEAVPKPEPVAEAAPKPEPVKQEQPVSVQKTEVKVSTEKKQSKAKSASNSNGAAVNRAAASQPEPVAEPVQPYAEPVPQPVSNLNEVPSMVPDFNTYEQLRQTQLAVQAASYDGQYIPSLFGDEAYMDRQTETPVSNGQTPAPAPSSGNTSGGSSGTSKHDFSGGRLLGSLQSDKYHNQDCRAAQNILDENVVWFNSAEEAANRGYSPCGICYK